MSQIISGIEQNALPDSGALRSFLGKVDYRLFNHWPGITEAGLVDYLFDDLQLLHPANFFWGTVPGGEIVALLVYQDLAWDSQHYGFQCGQIKYLLTNNEMDILAIQASLKKILDNFQRYCLTSRKKFVSVDLGSWETVKSFALQGANFRYILTWVDGFSQGLKDYPVLPDSVEVGPIKPDVVQYFSELSAKHYFKGGRFYLDQGFAKNKVDEMYGKLVKSSFEKNDIMLTYSVSDEPKGLFICKKILKYKHFSDLRVAPLRFLLVDPEYRNKRTAYDFFKHTIRYLIEQSDLVTTGLEVHNFPSINLHSKLGFKFNYSHNVFHWWNASL